MGKKTSQSSLKDTLKQALESNSALAEAITRYRELSEKVKRLLSQSEVYEKRQAEAQASLDKAEVKRQELLEKGEDPSSTEADVLAARAEVANLEPWRKELDARLIPKAKREMEVAKMAVCDAARVVLEGKRELIHAPVAELVDQIREGVDAWRAAQKEALAEIGLAEEVQDMALPSGQLLLDRENPLRFMTL